MTLLMAAPGVHLYKVRNRCSHFPIWIFSVLPFAEYMILSMIIMHGGKLEKKIWKENMFLLPVHFCQYVDRRGEGN